MPTFIRRWYLNSLFVHPEYRRRGIARRPVDRVIDAAWCDEMVLNVKTDRPHLLEFYGMWGFTKQHVSRNHHRDDSDRFILARDGRAAAA